MVGRAAERSPLLERERELAAITAAVDATAAGHGTAVWVEGPAGIGKTRLLRMAREHAVAAGVRVLSARGSALERDFAFGVVRGLFEAVVTAQPALIGAGPARLAAPVVTLVEEPSAAAAVTSARLHGLYWLTVGLADSGPLLLVVDDAHWADEPSREALAYLARRVEGLPVGILLASRSDLGTPHGEDIREDPATVVLRPGPLSSEACDRLVRAALGAAAPAFLDACHEAAGGNPLLLEALLATLSENAVAPDDAGVDAVRNRAPAIVAMLVLPRLRHLPPEAGAFARAVAVLGSAADVRRAGALAGLDPSTAVDAADALIAAELLTAGRPLAFSHPLVAEAITAHMSTAERHRGHYRAARCLARENADPERVAAHLLVVERLGDAWVVARLRAAAAAALVKGAPGATITYLRRAVAEPCPASELAELLVALGTAQVTAADGNGYRTLRRAWELTSDPRAAARVALAVSRAARNGGIYRPAQDIVTAAVAALGDTDADLVDELHTELAMASRIGTAPGTPSAARVSELAATAAGRGAEAMSLALRLAALNPLFEPGASAAAGAVAARAAELASRVAVDDVGGFYMACNTLVAVDRSAAVLPAVDAMIESARRAGSINDLGVATTMRAQIRYVLGRLRDAEEDARLADRLAARYDPGVRRHTKAWLVCCLVERGEAAEAENELAGSGVPMTLAHLLMARARLRLAQDRAGEALADLDECARRLRARDIEHPNFAPWQAWSAVTLLRLGRAEEARTRAADAVDTAREFGSARAEGVALWATGLVERSPGTLSEAVAALRGAPAPVELARALIDLGAMLRRANHRSDARKPLEEGLRIAFDCGAGALVAAARQELVATGAHVRRRAVTGPNALTPAERRIADLAAGGASNRDIAQTLFVTPKTVENHLGNAYRKLGVAGRTELAAALGH